MSNPTWWSGGSDDAGWAVSHVWIVLNDCAGGAALAQIDDEASRKLLIGLAGFAGIVLGGLAVAMLVRKLQNRASQGVEAEETGPGFSLGELRRLHREGALSDDEYQRARDAVLLSMGAIPTEIAPPLGPQGGEDPDPAAPADPPIEQDQPAPPETNDGAQNGAPDGAPDDTIDGDQGPDASNADKNGRA
ncbi:MAG: hypothetical protein AAF288_07465 [Planctomycetota bacterium]